MLVLGEIRTCLLHHSTALPTSAVVQLLDLLPGRKVLSAERPIARAVSPSLATGVDCSLAAQRMKSRGIGTVGYRAVVTGGTVLQGAAVTHVRRAVQERRMPWSYSLARSTTSDVVGHVDAQALSAGFLEDDHSGGTLNLGAVSGRLLTTVLRRPQLDNDIPLRARQTRVRWAARVDAVDQPVAQVRIRDEVTRTVELTVREEDLPMVASFCEDFALHDWLLTVLSQAIDQAERIKALGGDYVSILGAAVERLIHLWMPMAHMAHAAAAVGVLWESLERSPGLSRQWMAQVAQIRDQVAVATLQELLRARA